MEETRQQHPHRNPKAGPKAAKKRERRLLKQQRGRAPSGDAPSGDAGRPASDAGEGEGQASSHDAAKQRNPKVGTPPPNKAEMREEAMTCTWESARALGRGEETSLGFCVLFSCG